MSSHNGRISTPTATFRQLPRYLSPYFCGVVVIAAFGCSCARTCAGLRWSCRANCVVYPVCLSFAAERLRREEQRRTTWAGAWQSLGQLMRICSCLLGAVWLINERPIHEDQAGRGCAGCSKGPLSEPVLASSSAKSAGHQRGATGAIPSLVRRMGTCAARFGLWLTPLSSSLLQS